MDVIEIRTLFAFNRWANDRILTACRLLTDEEFQRDLRSSHGGVRGTLVHTLWAEWVWFRRWVGESPKTVLDEKDFPDVTAVESRWNELDQERRLFLATISDEKLTSTFSYVNRKEEHWEYSYLRAMQHTLNHSTYHRGQIVTMLRQLDRTPPVTDLLVFFDEGGGKS
ncbi:MAG TPA: DinB family protein [Candidatus Krumholzibacteria bacterium]|nr:DinB family protein [Candidatus Krumholzibacteria bacterium]